MQLKTFITALVFIVCVYGNSSAQKESAHQRSLDTPVFYPITFHSYFSTLGRDCKEILVAPAKIKKNQVLSLGLFAGITVGLVFIDPSVDNYIIKLENRNRSIRPVGAVITKFGESYAGYTVGTIGLIAYIFNDKKLKTTTWLATQAIITSGALTWIGKIISSRERPSVAFNHDSYKKGGTWHGLLGYIDNFADTKTPPGAGYDAFPSGHTSLAFSIATVYAKMYKDHPVVPVIAYTAASLVGLSRLTQHDHWISDVFVGAALGYVCGDQVVRTYRHSCIVQSRKKIFSNAVYSLDYSQGNFFAGIKWRL